MIAQNRLIWSAWINVAVNWVWLMQWNFRKIWKKNGGLWQGEGISTFGLIGSCCQSELSSPAVTQGRRRWFDSTGFVPLRKLQSHFMKLDLLSVCSNVTLTSNRPKRNVSRISSKWLNWIVESNVLPTNPCQVKVWSDYGQTEALQLSWAALNLHEPTLLTVICILHFSRYVMCRLQQLFLFGTMEIHSNQISS